MKKHRSYSKHTISMIALSYIIITFIVEIALFVTGFIYGQQGRAIFVAMLVLPVSATLITAGLIYISHMSSGATDKLITAIQRLADGDFSVRIDVDGGRFGFDEVYEKFNRMAAELSSVKALREDYVRNFSHEIKTPLASINGFAKLLDEGKLSDEEKREVIGIIVNESDRLSRLSNNILLLSKVENQQLADVRKEFRLDLQIKDCIIMLAREWEEKKITINSRLESVTYYGDEQLLKQVWINLLANAVKFTPDNGEITVELVKRGGAAVVTVADNGIGLTPEQAGHVFDKYYQAGKSTAGSGLGLTICRRICELSGGEISVESKYGEGSTFTVKLK